MTTAERKLMQHVARKSDTIHAQNNGGWVVYGTHVNGRDDWTWDTHRPLVAAGLLDRREDWKNVHVKLTDAGWSALAREPESDS